MQNTFVREFLSVTSYCKKFACEWVDISTSNFTLRTYGSKKEGS